MTRALSDRRPRRTTPLVALIAVALLGAACTPLTPSGAPSSAETPAASAELTTATAYFFRGSFSNNRGLVPVLRQVPRLEPFGATQRAAIEALLAGPSADELGASPALFTTLPEGTRILDLAFDATIATIDLSGEFAGGGSASARARLAQIVYTLTAFGDITFVRFKIDGTPVTVFTDAAVDLSEPVNRSDFADVIPAIFIDQPAWGGVLANPARIVGLADVFEATFRARIIDGGGHQLADVQVMASCGSGCLGTFDETIPYAAAAAGPGTLQVYEPSAVDGSPTNVSEYPVTLSP